jgi:hypothetical protein
MDKGLIAGFRRDSRRIRSIFIVAMLAAALFLLGISILRDDMKLRNSESTFSIAGAGDQHAESAR